jgi:uncharacterized protein YceK
MKKIIFITISLSVLSGCSSIREMLSPEDKNSLSGAGSIISVEKNKDFEEINLEGLLQRYGLDDPKIVANEYSEDTKVNSYQYKRNDIQERIITSSNQKCSAYLRTLNTSKSTTKTAWTSLSLLLSGAAAVIPHAATAQALAVGSTASTGILNSYNESYFNNLTITVIESGISKKRLGIHEGIKIRQKDDLKAYTIHAAISDALLYHAACNMVSGMEAASKALQAVTADKVVK